MSAKIATATSVVLTDKFKKELEKFFSWAVSSEYIIKDINDEQHEWSVKLLNKFEEPGRNKLEAYIKALFAKYTISLNGMDIEDAKLLAKEFKEKGEKVKKTTKKSDDVESEKPKKTTKKSVEKSEEAAVETPKKTTKKSEAIEVEEPNIKLDMSLDTSECFNVDTLEFWTSELTQVFGKPKKTGGKDQEHTWEWKLEVNDEVYTIYDWNENGEEYEEATWYLGSTSENKKNIKALVSYIESWFDAPEQEAEVVETKTTKKATKKTTKKEAKEVVPEPEPVVEEKVDMDELFGPDSDNEEIELDLDDIEDDE